MANLRSMAELLAKHASRGALAQLAPAPPRRVPEGQGTMFPDTDPPPAAAKTPRRLEVRRVARGEGYDLVVGGSRAVGVQPGGGGWIVKNVVADCKATFADAREADILTARNARMLAPQ